MKHGYGMVLLGALASVDCGGKASVDGSSTAAGGGAGGSSGSGLAASCSAFDNVPGATAVTFTIVNPLAEDLWLVEPICGEPQLSLSFGNTNVTQPRGSCNCQSERTDSYACVFTCDGPSDNLTRIPPGATLTRTWSGEAAESKAMPEACYVDQLNQHESCWQWKPAPAGSYVGKVTLYTGVQCGPAGGGDCTCTPSEKGGTCTLQAFGTSTKGQLEFAATFDVPSATMVTLTAK